MVGKLWLSVMPVYSNGCYDIAGFCVNKTIYGFIIKSCHWPVAKVGDWVAWNLYHLPTDKEPQFRRVR